MDSAPAVLPPVGPPAQAITFDPPLVRPATAFLHPLLKCPPLSPGPISPPA